MTVAMHAQTLPAIEKALKDPKRAENEAKAEVLLIDKYRIFDESTFNRERKENPLNDKIVTRKENGKKDR